MKKWKFGHYYALFFTLFIISIIILSIRQKRNQDEIINNGKEIIVQFTKKEEKPKQTYFHFSYYVGNEKKATTNNGIGYSMFDSEKETRAIDSLKIRRFYIAKFLSKYPDAIIVNPYKEVTDTTAILNAGFSKHDMTLPPKYSPDY